MTTFRHWTKSDVDRFNSEAAHLALHYAMLRMLKAWWVTYKLICLLDSNWPDRRRLRRQP